MTDNEIIKALECCSKYPEEQDCSECPLNSRGADCLDFELGKFVLDLINRQKEEIERLKTENKDISEQFRILDVECERLEKANEKQKAEIERLNSPYEMQVEASKKLENSIKAEAVKEFAERLKKKAVMVRGYFIVRFLIDTYSIDNLVKEMVGES